ncbi:MAG: RNA polymerase sigma factor [Ilumatobacter sp.]|uniref:RNA polymerase sigma factor n=1 Tax=Ilumatobacter sp. TaxID=1967498 RepID=UPI00391B7CBE
MTNDSDIVNALRAGDEDAFRAIVTELNPGLTRLARTYVTQALAEEVVQETWAAVIRSIGSFEQRSSLKTWVYRIMLNKVRTLAPREAKIVPFAAMGHTSDGHHQSIDPDRLMAEGAPGHWTTPPPDWQRLPADQLETHETLNAIRSAIEQLPPAQQEVVQLRDVHGWTADEVCNTLGISSVNQRVLLHRGRTALRSILEEHYIDA